MATVEERMKILKMIEEGKISAEEGAKLLAALTESRKSASGAQAGTGPGDARWLRIRVTDTSTGKAKVNVNLPIGLVNVGLKLGARFSPDVDEDQMEALAEALKSGLSGKIIDVTDEDDGEHVEIFVE